MTAPEIAIAPHGEDQKDKSQHLESKKSPTGPWPANKNPTIEDDSNNKRSRLQKSLEGTENPTQ